MNDHQDLLDQLEFLERVLNNVSRELQDVADRFAEGAMLRYPGEFKDKELSSRRENLVKKADEVVEKMAALHKKIVS